MKEYTGEKIRNVAIVGHGGSGTTSLTEALLYRSGAINRMCKVEDGQTTTDYEPEEIKRGVSVNATLAPVEWNGTKINFIDTPGFADFVAEVKGAFRAVDSALIVVCATSGVQVGTEQCWKLAEEAGLPRIIFVNKMDRYDKSHEDVLSMLKQFGADPVECDELNVSNIDDVLEQSKLVSRAEVRGGKYIVTCGKETEIFNRTTISKASDELAYAKDTYAAFAIAKINEEAVAISARSNRKMNVQLIMEKLGGGGHLTMAGVQKVNVTIEELKKQLIDVVDEYFKESENESNIA